mmetsp:Transcript_30154/g.55490  ORF Transcript_30154/g.55490 Transcript_30154/m.55490 type:complete len:481 (-) Transcript_30154:40-1482(-)
MWTACGEATEPATDKDLLCRCKVHRSDGACVCAVTKRPCCNSIGSDEETLLPCKEHAAKTHVAPIRNLLDHKPSAARSGCVSAENWNCAPREGIGSFEDLFYEDIIATADPLSFHHTGRASRGGVQMVRAHESDIGIGLPLRGAVIGPGADVEICKQVNFRPSAGLWLGTVQSRSAANGGVSRYGTQLDGPWVFELPQNEARSLVEQALFPREEVFTGPVADFTGFVPGPFNVDPGSHNSNPRPRASSGDLDLIIGGAAERHMSRGNPAELNIAYSLLQQEGGATYFWGTEKELDYNTPEDLGEVPSEITESRVQSREAAVVTLGPREGHDPEQETACLHFDPEESTIADIEDAWVTPVGLSSSPMGLGPDFFNAEPEESTIADIEEAWEQISAYFISSEPGCPSPTSSAREKPAQLTGTDAQLSELISNEETLGQAPLEYVPLKPRNLKFEREQTSLSGEYSTSDSVGAPKLALKEAAI